MKIHHPRSGLEPENLLYGTSHKLAQGAAPQQQKPYKNLSRPSRTNQGDLKKINQKFSKV